MSEHARRLSVALYDQFEDEHPIADWGGDELFTRMPRPRAVDDAPAPRFKPAAAAAPDRSLALVEPLEDARRAPDPAREPERGDRRAEQAMRARAERLGIALVDPAPAHRWDESGALIEPEPRGRRTTVITGHPDGAPRPLPTVRAERRRPSRTPAEWVGAKPERIVAWAFVLGLLLIMIAISTADAATL